MANIPSFSPKALSRGLVLPFRGMAYLLANRGLKRYAALPLVVNIFLYVLAFLVFFYFLSRWQVSNVAWEFLGPVGGWLAAAVNWMGWMVKLVVVLVALGAAFFTFTAVGMVVASPFNDMLSEKVELSYTGGGKRLDMPFRFTTKAAMISLYDSLRNLVRQLGYTVIALPFLLVPVVGFVPLFLVGGYFAGFGFLDAAMARNYLRPPHKRLISRGHFWEIVGFGIMMQGLFAIPLIGILLMPVGVVAGTLLYCGEDWEKLLREAGMDKPPGFQPPKPTMVTVSESLPAAG